MACEQSRCADVTFSSQPLPPLAGAAEILAPPAGFDRRRGTPPITAPAAGDVSPIMLGRRPAVP